MPRQLEDIVVSTIASPDLQDGLADLAEVGLDQLLASGVLRDVPVLGTFVNAVRAAGHVRDALLVRKLARFFAALNKVPLHERERFCHSLGSRADQRRVGEALLLLLDRLDDMAKPEIVARVFRAFIRGEIDRVQFGLMSAAIDRLHVSRMSTLLEFYEKTDTRVACGSVGVEAYQEFSFVGLAQLSIGSNGAGWFDPAMAGGAGAYVQNDLGRLLAGILRRDS